MLQNGLCTNDLSIVDNYGGSSLPQSTVARRTSKALLRPKDDIKERYRSQVRLEMEKKLRDKQIMTNLHKEMFG
jgi:hypothetical protein